MDINNARIYNKVLTEEEIEELYISTKFSMDRECNGVWNIN